MKSNFAFSFLGSFFGSYLAPFLAVILGFAVCSGSLAAQQPDLHPEGAPLKIFMAQLDIWVGNFPHNYEMIKASYEAAVNAGADLWIGPELGVSGYAAGDLFRKPEFIAENGKYTAKIRELTIGKKTALLIGHLTETHPGFHGRPLFNSASVFENGKSIFLYHKKLLPTYGLYEDLRYFQPGTLSGLFKFRGKNIFIGICEDFWGDDEVQGHRRYTLEEDPTHAIVSNGKAGDLDLAISLSSSPFHAGKGAQREAVHSKVARRLKVPLIWNGHIGNTDGTLVDGRSFVLNSKGHTVFRLPAFKSASALIEVSKSNLKILDAPRDKRGALHADATKEIDVVIDGLISGIRDYMHRTGQRGFINGLSGGIDSSVTAALQREALGPENVIGYALPSDHSSQESLDLARKTAENLGIEFHVISIANTLTALQREFGGSGNTFEGWPLNSIAYENTQARIRMSVLNAQANHRPGFTVSVNANKVEISMGYYTFGGDDKGGLAIIGDLWKTQVYEIARRINERFGNPIPEGVFKRAATAELLPGGTQTDEGSLGGPFWAIEPVLRGTFEQDLSPTELDRRYRNLIPTNPQNWVFELIKRANIQEYKRRQSAPVLRVSARPFDWVDRRIPIAAVKLLGSPALDACLLKLTRNQVEITFGKSISKVRR